MNPVCKCKVCGSTESQSVDFVCYKCLLWYLIYRKQAEGRKVMIHNSRQIKGSGE